MHVKSKVNANPKIWYGNDFICTFASDLIQHHTQVLTLNNKTMMKQKMFFLMAALLMYAAHVNAQTTKVEDKDLIGVWLMESMQHEGGKKIVCGKETGYAQFKYYGADGEYACAEIALSKDGKCVVMPHEYGTYTYKNGEYSEMGRPSSKGDMQLIDKTTFKGRWKTRHDVWKKQTAMPDKLVKYIIDCCKMKNMPSDIQQSMKQHIFK